MKNIGLVLDLKYLQWGLWWSLTMQEYDFFMVNVCTWFFCGVCPKAKPQGHRPLPCGDGFCIAPIRWWSLGDGSPRISHCWSRVNHFGRPMVPCWCGQFLRVDLMFPGRFEKYEERMGLLVFFMPSIRVKSLVDWHGFPHAMSGRMVWCGGNYWCFSSAEIGRECKWGISPTTFWKFEGYDIQSMIRYLGCVTTGTHWHFKREKGVLNHGYFSSRF